MSDTSVILALGRLRQEDYLELEASPDYRVRLSQKPTKPKNICHEWITGSIGQQFCILLSDLYECGSCFQICKEGNW